MKRILFSVLISLFSLTVLSQSNVTEHGLTPAEKAYVLSRFCNEVKYNFAFYDRLTFDWDSICMASLPNLVNSETDEDFVKGLQALCTRLQDGHTFVTTLNNPINPSDWVRPFPMKTKRIGDKVFVTDVFSSVLQTSNVTPGCEIIEINGDNVIDYARKNLEPYFPSSTPQWTKYSPFSDYNLTKDKGSKVSKILFRDKEGNKFLFESDRLIPWDLSQDDQTMDFRILKGNVGLLTVRSFQNGEFDRELFGRLYNEVLNTDALIIDLRDNSGGNSEHADYMMRHLTDKPILQGSWTSPMYIAAHGSWKYPREWHRENPNPLLPIEDKKVYLNPVVLLVNASTFSSAENFCVLFKGADRGKIIGTPTGGSTGNPIFIDLGFGIGCGICTKHELDAKGNEFIGIGIQPDIIVEEDADQYLKNRDNVIITALEILDNEAEQ